MGIFVNGANRMMFGNCFQIPSPKFEHSKALPLKGGERNTEIGIEIRMLGCLSSRNLNVNNVNNLLVILHIKVVQV